MCILRNEGVYYELVPSVIEIVHICRYSAQALYSVGTDVHVVPHSYQELYIRTSYKGKLQSGAYMENYGHSLPRIQPCGSLPSPQALSLIQPMMPHHDSRYLDSSTQMHLQRSQTSHFPDPNASTDSPKALLSTASPVNRHPPPSSLVTRPGPNNSSPSFSPLSLSNRLFFAKPPSSSPSAPLSLFCALLKPTRSFLSGFRH